MSGKSPTIGDLGVSRSSPIFATNTGIDRENRNCFYFADLSPFNPDDRDANVFVFHKSGMSGTKIADRRGFSRHMRTRLYFACAISPTAVHIKMYVSDEP